MSAFAALAVEAIRDAVRRRIVAAIVLLSLVSLTLVDGCTACAAGQVVVNGESRSIGELAGASGALLFGVLGLWVVVLAGVLGSDHLQQTLEDGSANLCLARPVSRNSFVAARLVGVLVIALVAGAVLLVTAAGLLHVRSGLAIAPAISAGCAVALGAVVAGALAMALSLSLPRLATVLVVFVGVGTMTVANLVMLFNRGEGQGTLAWIDRIGPPFATAIGAALAPWVRQVDPMGDEGVIFIRLGLWAVGALVLLVLVFRRREILD